MNDTFEQFIFTLTGEKPPLSCTGKVVRFGPKQRFWCVLFHDRAGGVFGDWRTGDQQHWFARKPLNPAEMRKTLKNVEQSKRQRDNRNRLKYERAATEAREIWSVARPAPINFKYLKNKKIKPDVFRLQFNRLILPLQNVDGQLVNLQYIDANGVKRFLCGGEVVGNFSIIQRAPKYSRILICEGAATACSLAEIDPSAFVVAAMNAGNLLPVTENISRMYPDAPLVVCGDNDRFTEGNPGKTKAIAAARAVGGKYAIPQFSESSDGTDFNDLHCGKVSS